MSTTNPDKVYFAPKAKIYLAGFTEAATKLPADLTTAVDAVFKELGYTSDDGISLTPKREWEPVQAHQSASPIKYVLKSAAVTLKFVCLQTDPETVQLYFGDKWTVVGGVNKLVLKSTPKLAEHALIVEWGDWAQDDTATPPVLTGVKSRLVIPRGMVSDVDEVKIGRTEVQGLGVTFDAMDKSEELGYLLTNAT